MAFKTFLENRATEASSLEAFSRLSLHGIRETVATLLGLIGKEGIFREYTRHDISHIDKLLQMLEWIIPSTTLSKMTIADCLMITLAVYLHDLGMLVTKDEFDRRGESRFPEFKKSMLDGEEGKDYLDKVNKMPADHSERFLYQEFVRRNHAERIRSWVTGRTQKHLGAADKVVGELDRLLDGLEGKFRKDLGMVCESHHLNDLRELDKYKTSQPYGSGPQETANLQYCAILLRTADLLYVTRDRAPSIEFRMINPSDPKSVEEWHKQMPVISVRPKPGVDEEGNVVPGARMDTIEVSGLFKEPQGFFSLTAYLNYARKELRQSNDWAELAKKRKGVTYDFPWREIDDSGLEAEGFIDRQFEFTLDQAKILDLLTGQTLYNDTTVVLRELVQNSLDAIRLEWEHEPGFIDEGQLEITWDSIKRVLTVQDNGTGMTQRIIDAHFLKVGSSYYQDEEFRKLHSGFSAISRFGIGVLSTFMISDEIEVTTCHRDDDQARTLSLRSLHGKYLVRLIEKDAPELPTQIIPHGTKITLIVRPSAELKDPESILRRWIIFPRCKVTLTVDRGQPISIGYSEPKEALKKGLTSLGIVPFEWHDSNDSSEPKDHVVKVEQRSKEGITLAYALQWSSYFREWTFLMQQTRERTEQPATGSCIEGVRVDIAAPGFLDTSLTSLANAVGPKAPKTNVARSGLEVTPERKALLMTEYELYCDHVKSEVEKLQDQRGFSLTWALGEAIWMLDTLMSGTARVHDYDALRRACAEVPTIALEEGGSRVAISARQLSEYEHFWTVDSMFFSSAEALIREIPGPVAISRLASSMGAESLRLPHGPYISANRPRSATQSLAFQNREVDQIIVHRDQRRVDLRWANVASPRLWRSVLPENTHVRQVLIQAISNMAGQFGQGLSDIWIELQELKREGLDHETTIRSLGRTFILPDSEYHKYLLQQLQELDNLMDPVRLAAYATALLALNSNIRIQEPAEFVRQQSVMMSRMPNLGFNLKIDPDPALITALASTTFVSFNPQAWIRGQ